MKKKISKKDLKKIEKAARKRPILFLVTITILLVCVGVLLYGYEKGWLDTYLGSTPNPTITTTTTVPTTAPTSVPTTTAIPTTTQTTVAPTTVPTEVPTTPSTTTVEPTTTPTTEVVTEKIVDNIIYDNFQVHFLRMGDETYSTDYSKNSGDSVYIKAGENDILIDAGSRDGSAGYIKKYVDQYCTDGKLEYVIATHADQDHIAGFVGTTKYPGIFDSYKVDTIIDFARSDKTTQVYNNYKTKRDAEVASGATHYTAAESFSANAIYTLGEGISFKVLYNKYYFEKSSDENNYSVCTLFTYNDRNFIFTGDLEEDGEKYLAQYYDGSTLEKTLPKVELYKAGHHGSKTSSNDCLLSKIQPEICVACCCAGYPEYTPVNDNIFPTQDFISRIARYTDRVYVTSVFNEKTLKPQKMNGDVIISCNGNNIGVSSTNNITKLKDTEWFNDTVYLNPSGYIVSAKGKTDFFTATTANCAPAQRRIWPSYGV